MRDMKGDLESQSTPLSLPHCSNQLLEISHITFCWMLQCISPYLTIDQSAFRASSDQYQRWLDEVRYNCRYHHSNWLDWAKSKLPNFPIINPAPDPLDPPKRSPAHQHLDFDYGYGTGPIVDSYTGFYHLAGSVPRVPGRCKVEIWDSDAQEYKLSDANGHGQTYEYIHPVCHYRDLVRGPEPNSALRDFTRTFEKTPGGNGRGRFWWQKRGDTKSPLLPEWIILPHEGEGVLNYERVCYAKSEKTKQKVEVLEKKGVKKDWLGELDEVNDFGMGTRDRWSYP